MVHEASTYESFLEDQLGKDILINFDLDTVRIKMMIPVKSQRAFCVQKHFQPGLTTHLVLRTNATIRDYQPETSTGDTIHDDQREQRNYQKNIVANVYNFLS